MYLADHVLLEISVSTSCVLFVPHIVDRWRFASSHNTRRNSASVGYKLRTALFFRFSSYLIHLRISAAKKRDKSSPAAVHRYCITNNTSPGAVAVDCWHVDTDTLLSSGCDLLFVLSFILRHSRVACSGASFSGASAGKPRTLVSVEFDSRFFLYCVLRPVPA